MPLFVFLVAPVATVVSFTGTHVKCVQLISNLFMSLRVIECQEENNTAMILVIYQLYVNYKTKNAVCKIVLLDFVHHLNYKTTAFQKLNCASVFR